MSDNVPKYIQKAIDDLRVKNEKLKKTSYVLFILIISYLAYNEYTDPRYFNFGCVDVVFSNEFITYEYNDYYRIPKKYEGLDTSKLNKTVLFKSTSYRGYYDDRKNLSISEIYELNREFKNLTVDDCVGFLDYYFDN